MIMCKNEKCDNFKQELDDHVEICPACGEKTEKLEIKNEGIKKLAPIIAIVSIFSIMLTFFLFDWIPNFYVSFSIGALLIIGCIVLAFISKSVGAIVTTLLAAAGFIGVFFYYGIF